MTAQDKVNDLWTLYIVKILSRRKTGRTYISKEYIYINVGTKNNFIKIFVSYSELYLLRFHINQNCTNNYYVLILHLDILFGCCTNNFKKFNLRL